MAHYSLKQISDIVNGKCHGNEKLTITDLLIDSRSVGNGPETLFFAIKGQRHNGHDYIGDVIEQNVTCFVVSQKETVSKYNRANFILVGNTLEALQKLTAYHRKQTTIPIIGITGSNGKTIVKEWIYQVLHEDKRITKSPKSYNSQVGVPLSVWQLDGNSELGIFEAGISKCGEMGKIERIIQPTIGIITNIGEAHQENFATVREKTIEKCKLFKNADTILYCKDYDTIHDVISNQKELQDKEKFTWSYKGSANLEIKDCAVGQNATRIEAYYKNEKQSVSIPFMDKASIENAIHVWAVMLYLEYSITTIESRFKQLSSVAMRLELKKGINNCTIINDSFNSDLVSLNVALDFLEMQNQHLKKTIILSDIQQSGRPVSQLYTEVSKVVKNSNINRFIGIGNDIFTCQHIFKTPSVFFKTTESFLRSLHEFHFNDETILIKGAREFQFERISDALEEIMHQTVLEIDLNALVHNLNYFKSRLHSTTKIMVMVKAFSYGSGSYEIANLLQHQQVDYLGVAFADEGITLKQAGISLPIMVMSPEKSAFDRIIEYDLEPEIFNFELLDTFSKRLELHGRNRYPIHIKLDTGMHRLGFDEEHMNKLVEMLSMKKNLFVKTVFSHLAASDNKHHDTFTRQQVCLFEQLTKKLKESLGYSFINHILNSAGIERFPDYQFDMVRLGIGLYGCSALQDITLKHISTLKSKIIQIKKLMKGETVGYDRAGKISQYSIIAIVPVGYADGINRKLGNGAWNFIINGEKAPTIGTICMDLCMVDITKINAKEGDDVIIFGEMNTITEIAEKLKTIPYEILTGISGRVKRVYFKE